MIRAAVSQARSLPQPTRFLLAGGVAAGINWLARFPLAPIMPFWCAVLIATAIGMAVGFVAYRRYVFPGSSRPTLVLARDFLAVNALSAGVVVAAAALAREALLPVLSVAPAEAIAHAAGIATGAVANYIGHGRVTFRDRSAATARAACPGRGDAPGAARAAGPPSAWTTVLILSAIGVLAFALYPHLLAVHSGDVDRWFAPWVATILEDGPIRSLAEPMRILVDGAHGYGNYNPPYLYLLIAGSLAHPMLGPFGIVKLVAIAGVLFSAACLYPLLRAFLPVRPALIAAASVILLPTPVLNGPLWGQIDTVWVGFAAVAVAAAIAERPASMLLAFGAAVAFKLQAVVIGPFLLYMAISRRIPLRLLILPAVAYVALVTPAWLAGRPAWELATIYLEQGQTYRWLSMNAPNPWAFVQHLHLLSYDTGVVVGLTATTLAGLAIGALALRRRLEGADLLLLALLSAALMPYLLPKMHERYFFLADLLAFALAVVRPRPWTIFVAVAIQLGSVGGYASHFLEWPLGKAIGAALIGVALVVVLMRLHRALEETGGSPATDLARALRRGRVARDRHARSPAE